MRTQYGKQLHIFMTNWGEEYTLKEFAAYCTSHGIIHEVATWYTPQHNALVKRTNISMLDMARFMMKEKKLPHEFWS